MEHIGLHLENRCLANRDNPGIRRIENGDWYWIGKKFLRIHARNLGASGIAVYNALASFANAKTQSCFPSQSTIGKITGMSKRTVSLKMRQLERVGLIRREKQKNQTVCYLLE
jgi:DNA-binding MarR family transcriptional regulator